MKRWRGREGRSAGPSPERGRAGIRAQQDRSEMAIGWIQLAVVLTFGTLYALSPKTFNADATIEPVSWVLALYTGFTLLRLFLACRRRLPAWFLALSVVIDIGLLLALTWSFHFQYEQPPSFVLKAPTLLYVFIFIALRTLRFEAGYVLFAGSVAAAGWLLLMTWVISVDSTDAMITQDYVAYMTSNSVLLEAEFDKVASILVVTGIIALAITRMRQLMVRSVAEGVAAPALSRFFAPEVAREITGADRVPEVGEGVVRDAAILVVDLRGFSAPANRILGRRGDELFTEYQARMIPTIRRHGGSIDKFLGDGILATFGAVVPSDRAAADALTALDEVFREAPLRVGDAVATDRVVFGAVGDADRLEYTVIGEAVNLALKLEKHTKAEGVSALATAVA